MALSLAALLTIAVRLVVPAQGVTAPTEGLDFEQINYDGQEGLWCRGVNIVGFDDCPGCGRWGYKLPDWDMLRYFHNLGANCFRLPITWARMQNELGSERLWLVEGFAETVDFITQVLGDRVIIVPGSPNKPRLYGTADFTVEDLQREIDILIREGFFDMTAGFESDGERRLQHHDRRLHPHGNGEHRRRRTYDRRRGPGMTATSTTLTTTATPDDGDDDDEDGIVDGHVIYLGGSGSSVCRRRRTDQLGLSSGDQEDLEAQLLQANYPGGRRRRSCAELQAWVAQRSSIAGAVVQRICSSRRRRRRGVVWSRWGRRRRRGVSQDDDGGVDDGADDDVEPSEEDGDEEDEVDDEDEYCDEYPSTTLTTSTKTETSTTTATATETSTATGTSTSTSSSSISTTTTRTDTTTTSTSQTSTSTGTTTTSTSITSSTTDTSTTVTSTTSATSTTTESTTSTTITITETTTISSTTVSTTVTSTSTVSTTTTSTVSTTTSSTSTVSTTISSTSTVSSTTSTSVSETTSTTETATSTQTTSTQTTSVTSTATETTSTTAAEEDGNETDVADDWRESGVGLRYRSQDVTREQFVALWKGITEFWGNNSRVIFALFNEPKFGFEDGRGRFFDPATEDRDGWQVEYWRQWSQAAINAIRDTGANNLVLVPGLQYSHCTDWSGNSWWGEELNIGGSTIQHAGNTRLAAISDPFLNTAYDLHQYMDLRGTGEDYGCEGHDTNFWCVQAGDSCTGADAGLQRTLDWARRFKKKLFMSEIGSYTDEFDHDNENWTRCEEKMFYYLERMHESERFIGYTAYQGGCASCYGDLWSLRPGNLRWYRLPDPDFEDCAPLVVHRRNGQELYVDCRSHGCCQDGSGHKSDTYKCYEKNNFWAGCRRECVAGINPDDPEEYQTPWSCNLIEGRVEFPWTSTSTSTSTETTSTYTGSRSSTTRRTTTMSRREPVRLSVVVRNANYDRLMDPANADLKERFISAIMAAVVNRLRPRGILADMLEVVLERGSVKATILIVPPASDSVDYEGVTDDVGTLDADTEFQSGMVQTIKRELGDRIDQVTTGPLTVVPDIGSRTVVLTTSTYTFADLETSCGRAQPWMAVMVLLVSLHTLHSRCLRA